MIDRFLRWLRPEHYSDKASCQLCGEVSLKSRMYHSDLYGFHCNESEFSENWFSHQI